MKILNPLANLSGSAHAGSVNIALPESGPAFLVAPGSV